MADFSYLLAFNIVLGIFLTIVLIVILYGIFNAVKASIMEYSHRKNSIFKIRCYKNTDDMNEE